MMWYVLIGLSLSLAGVAGLQFFYLIYLERIDREQKSVFRNSNATQNTFQNASAKPNSKSPSKMKFWKIF